MFPKQPVGVDIGSSGIRAAQTDRRGGVRQLHWQPLPAGAVVAGAVNDPTAVGAALDKLWARARFGTRDVNVCIGGPRVVTRRWDTEWMPPDSFRRALPFTTRDVVPVENPYLDYWPIDETTDPVKGRIARVLLVSCPRETLNRVLEATAGARLRVNSIDTVAFSLLRATVNRETVNPDPTLLLDIGADTTTMLMHRAGAPVRVESRTGLGSSTIDSALADTFSIGKDQAERAKSEVGLGTGEPQPAVPVISEHVSALISAARTFIELCAEPPGGDEPVECRSVTLTGAGSRLRGLPERMGAELGIPTTRFDPRTRFGSGTDGNTPTQPDFTAALGAATGGPR